MRNVRFLPLFAVPVSEVGARPAIKPAITVLRHSDRRIFSHVTGLPCRFSCPIRSDESVLYTQKYQLFHMLRFSHARNDMPISQPEGAILVALAPRKAKGRPTRGRPNLLLLQQLNGGHDKD